MGRVSIDIENVTVAYHGKIALHSASLQLHAGTICGLVGMNGAGKSTLFKAIMGFVKPTTGRILINGLSIRHVQKNSLVAYVPQSEEVDWQFPVSVYEVVMMGRYGYMNLLRGTCAIAKLESYRAGKRNALSLQGRWRSRAMFYSWMNRLQA
jgi:ABC-type Mn2+/Zn2+ transport system ATPase subunit